MSNRLPILASEIERLQRELQAATKTATERAIDIGAALVEAKSLCRHGEWSSWLKRHCRLSDRSARLYMRLAANVEELMAKTASVADLTITAAAELLAEPKSEVNWPNFALWSGPPEAGTVAVGVRDSEHYYDAIFVESSDVDGCFEITHVFKRAMDDDEGAVNMDILRRPVRAGAVHAVIAALVPNIFPAGSGMEWFDVPREHVHDIIALAKTERSSIALALPAPGSWKSRA